MGNDTKNRLAERVQIATVEAVQAMACPTCGGGLDVQFAPKGKRSKGAGSLSVTCTQCMWRVVTDGIPSEPPWVRLLGAKFQTLAPKIPPENDLRLLDHLAQHLGVLNVEYNNLDASGKQVGKSAVKTYSGFFIDLDAQWYFVTAGHVFEGTGGDGLLQAVKNKQVEIKGASILDFFGPNAKLEGGPTNIDFASVVQDTIIANDDPLGIDFAFMPLRDWYVTSIKGNGVIPLEIKNYKGTAQKYVVIGFPDEEKKASPDPNNPQAGTIRLCFARMDKCRLPRHLKEPALPYFAAKLPDEGPASAMGFSGSPVFAVDVDLKKGRTYYTLIGIDYKWYPTERIVVGCLMKCVLAEFRKRLKKRKPTQKRRQTVKENATKQVAV
jgi:hypothetical protein